MRARRLVITLLLLLLLLLFLKRRQSQSRRVLETTRGHDDEEAESHGGVIDPTQAQVDELLLETHGRCQQLFLHLEKKLQIAGSKFCVDSRGREVQTSECSDQGVTDLTTATRRLLRKHQVGNRMGKGRLVLTEFDQPDNKLLAANHNKGEEIQVCCKSKQCSSTHQIGDHNTPCQLNTIDGMMEVTLHELAHSMDCANRPEKSTHGPCFDQLQNALMFQAQSIDLFRCGPRAFCGIYHSKSGMCETNANQSKCDSQPECI